MSTRVSLNNAARWLARLAACFLASAAVTAAERPRHFFLELDIAIERGGAVGAIFDLGDGIWGENSAMAQVPYGTTPKPVRLQLPARPVRACGSIRRSMINRS